VAISNTSYYGFFKLSLRMNNGELIVALPAAGAIAHDAASADSSYSTLTFGILFTALIPNLA
jgi:hypothetical protein